MSHFPLLYICTSIRQKLFP